MDIRPLLQDGANNQRMRIVRPLFIIVTRQGFATMGPRLRDRPRSDEHGSSIAPIRDSRVLLQPPPATALSSHITPCRCDRMVDSVNVGGMPGTGITPTAAET